MIDMTGEAILECAVKVTPQRVCAYYRFFTTSNFLLFLTFCLHNVNIVSRSFNFENLNNDCLSTFCN